jgi:hypothetical protein
MKEEGTKISHYLFAIGFLAAVGILIPYLGRTFQPFGIHGRIVGTVLMALSGAMALRYVVQYKIDLPLILIASLFFSSFFLQAVPSQVREIFSPQFSDSDYIAGKLGRFVQLGLPVFLLGALLSPIRSARELRAGIGWGVSVVGLIAVIIATLNPVLFHATYESTVELTRTMTFSAISLSIIFSLTFCWLYSQAISRSGLSQVGCFAGAVVCLVFIIICRQRAHLLFILLFMAVPMLTGIKRALLVIFTLLTLVVVLDTFGEAILGPAVVSYWAEDALGAAAETRLQMLRDCFLGGIDEPAGRGLGSYALFFEIPYPHNAPAEAMFEIGVLGMILLLGIYALGLWRSAKAIRYQGMYNLFPVAAVAFIFAHSLKAGEMVDMIPLLCFWLFLVPTIRPTISQPVALPSAFDMLQRRSMLSTVGSGDAQR